MEFTTYTCWRPDMLQTVLGADATKTPDHVFKAIHQPVPMFRASATTERSQEAYDEQRFLKDFMEPEKAFVFVPVIGQSGTGKSHLIRWLFANIEPHDKRRVIFIPRLRTNLREILLMILSGLDSPRFNLYRQRLEEASSNLTGPQLRAHLLNNLAVEVGPEGQHDKTALTRTQQFLASKDGLIHLLYDPYFRDHLLRDGGIMDQLVEHTLGSQGKGSAVERHREFGPDDLPLQVNDLAKAGKQAQFVANHLRMKPEDKVVAVDWLNKHLNDAIKRVLNMGREDMASLMREVRESLAEDGVELVLLIEDIFKFQGVEHELLDAVIADPHQTNGKPLCRIRTALGCTTGYFQANLMDTLRTRISFITDLDVGEPGDQKSLVTGAYLTQFVARYLNTARLSGDQIQAWADQSRAGDDDQPESACKTCEHRKACHAGFGELNGVGLYPFNRRAIEEMTRLVHVSTHDTFRPRLVLSNVIGRVLDYHGQDIRDGAFPPASLLNHFGIKERNVQLQVEMKRLGDSDANVPRRETLLRLWSSGDKLVNLHEAVHTAFALPTLSIQETAKATGGASGTKGQATAGVVDGGPTTPPSGKKVVDDSGKLRDQIDALNRWMNGEPMIQSMMTDLRSVLFEALNDRIGWDTELLLRPHFVGAGRLFAGRNIQFRTKGKPSAVSVAGITLELPLVETDDERTDTILAFYAIVRFQHHGNWDYPQGFEDFLNYARMVDRWSQYILDQVRAPLKSGAPWDPVPATVEVLAVNACLAGRAVDTLPDLVDALFQLGGEQPLTGRSPAWTKLAQTFRAGSADKTLHGQLLEVVSARVPCTKGSSQRLQVIDASQLAGPLEAIRRDWTLRATVPEDLRFEVDPVGKARKQIDALLGPAVIEEHARHLAAHRRLLENIGKPESADEKSFLRAILDVAQLTQKASVWAGPPFEMLESAVKAYKKADVAAFARTAERLKAMAPAQALAELAVNHSAAIEAIDQLVDVAEKFLDASIARAERETEKLGQDEQASLASVNGIEKDLATLVALVDEVESGKEVTVC